MTIVCPEGKEPFHVHCGECRNEWVAAWLPMDVSEFATAAKQKCPRCGGGKVMIGRIPNVTPKGDPFAWLASGDTGISSETIWGVMMGRDMASAARFGNSPPYDPDDFGRCHRLLESMPGWRPRLAEVAEKFPAWKMIVKAWDELDALYLTERPGGSCPRLYARMQELTR